MAEPGRHRAVLITLVKPSDALVSEGFAVVMFDMEWDELQVLSPTQGSSPVSNINIERYAAGIDYSGLIEGVADDGVGWIIFLGSDGRPSVYYATREPSGAVVGEPVVLDA